MDKEALLALLTYECAGNIGQLRADVQLICARAFLAFKIGTNRERVEVDRTSLPEYIWLDYSKHRTQTNDLILFLQMMKLILWIFRGIRIFLTKWI